MTYLNVDECSPFHVAPSTPCCLDASPIKVSPSANQRLFPAGRMKESSNIGPTLLRGWEHHIADQLLGGRKQCGVAVFQPLMCDQWVISSVISRLVLVAPQHGSVFIFMTAEPQPWGAGGGIESDGHVQSEVGGFYGEAVVGLLCAQMYSLIPHLSLFLFCPCSSWIIPVSGLQYLLHLLHSKYTEIRTSSGWIIKYSAVFHAHFWGRSLKNSSSVYWISV